MANRLTRRMTLKFLAGSALAGLLPIAAFAQTPPDPTLSEIPPPPPPPAIRIVMIGKFGDKFFDGAKAGGEEAAGAIGGIDFSYLAPADITNQAQIKLVESYVAAKPKEKVDAIVIAANDARALAAVCRRALRRGIKVVSFHTPVAPDGRILHVASSTLPMNGTMLTQLMARAIGKSGEVAILSTSRAAEDQNAQIAAMIREWVKPDYSNMRLAATLYGNDKADQSYSEVEKLIKSRPDLKGIAALTPTASLAAVKAVTDAGLSGKVHVTGFGRPSDMKPALDSGVIESFAYWNPVDLGYSTVSLAASLVKGELKPKPSLVARAGRMGDLTIAQAGEVMLPGPFVFDKSNIEKFAAIF